MGLVDWPTIFFERRVPGGGQLGGRRRRRDRLELGISTVF
jgi:hypothetical protein